MNGWFRRGSAPTRKAVSRVFNLYREMQERKKAGESSESGFTLIELLIVIVVLGILAAIVIFSLTGVTGQSQSAACNSDAKTVDTAVSAYEAENPSIVPTMADLTATGGHGPYLKAAPTATLATSGYQIQLGTSGNVQVETSKQKKPTWTDYDTPAGAALCSAL